MIGLGLNPAVNTWKIIEWSNILFGMLSRHARQKSAYFRTIWWATLALYDRRHYHDQEYAKYQDKGKISKWYNLLFRVSQIKESMFALKKIWDILRDILYLGIEYSLCRTYQMKKIPAPFTLYFTSKIKTNSTALLTKYRVDKIFFIWYVLRKLYVWNI